MQSWDLRGAEITRVWIDAQSDVHIIVTLDDEERRVLLSTAQVVDILGQYPKRGFTLDAARKYLVKMNHGRNL